MYTAEMRLYPSKMETTEMKILQRISEKRLVNMEIRAKIRRPCNVEEINS